MLLYSHPTCQRHDTGPGHPESGQRLRAVLQALESEQFALLERREAPKADRAAIVRVHPARHIDRVMGAAPLTGHALLDGDTVLSPESVEAALRAAGALCAAVAAVVGGEADRAFCAIRPPGHHAEPDRAMGFCIFNNVAVGAQYARAEMGLNRIAVLDFDVHHGNGTQATCKDEPNIFFASSHQSPLYPGTGRREETGHGNIVNVPLPPHADGKAFRAAWTDAIFPALRAFEPELILVSAGFDAHEDDPLAQLRLREDDYAWVTREICSVANDVCRGRIVSTLEGGYNLEALAASCAVHVQTMMET